MGKIGIAPNLWITQRNRAKVDIIDLIRRCNYRLPYHGVRGDLFDLTLLGYRITANGVL